MQCSGGSRPVFLLSSARAQRPPILQPVMCCWKLNWRFCSARPVPLAPGWLPGPAFQRLSHPAGLAQSPRAVKTPGLETEKSSAEDCVCKTQGGERRLVSKTDRARRREAGGGLAWPGGPAAAGPRCSSAGGSRDPARALASRCIVLTWGASRARSEAAPGVVLRNFCWQCWGLGWCWHLM